MEKERRHTVVTSPGIHIHSSPLGYELPLILDIPNTHPRQVQRHDREVPQRLPSHGIHIDTLLLVRRITERVDHTRPLELPDRLERPLLDLGVPRQVPHAPLHRGADRLEPARQHAQADGRELRLREAGLPVPYDAGLDARPVRALLDLARQVAVEPVQVPVPPAPHLPRPGRRPAERVQTQQRDVVLHVARRAAEPVELVLHGHDLLEERVLHAGDPDTPVDGHRQAEREPLDERQRVDGLGARLAVDEEVADEGAGLGV